MSNDNVLAAFDYISNHRPAYCLLREAVAVFDGGAVGGPARRKVYAALSVAAKDCRKCFPEEVADGAHPWLKWGDPQTSADVISYEDADALIELSRSNA